MRCDITCGWRVGKENNREVSESSRHDVDDKEKSTSQAVSRVVMYARTSVRNDQKNDVCAIRSSDDTAMLPTGPIKPH